MIVRFLWLSVLFVAAMGAVPAAQVNRAPATGVFTDSAGATHPWSINDSHALYWDNAPYLPVGAVFQSHFLSGVTTSDSWHDDLEQLAQFKKHHVMSILIEPMGPPGSLLETPASAVQALIDVLDSQGFTYGFALEGSPSKTWNATIIHPSIYRDPAPPESATVTFRNITNLVSAQYFLVSALDGSILNHGQASIEGDTATVKLKPGDGGDGTVLLLYPLTRMTEGADSEGLPDIWSGADDFRDALLLYFSRIHFGKGLRFFLDPIRVEGDLIATTEGGMMPDDDDFRLRFQTWLLDRYSRSRVRLDDAWGIKNQDLTDFAVASRCLPLWFQAKGIGELLDPQTGITYETEPKQSAVWTDITQFQTWTIQRSMNDVADAVKQGIGDVPVVYRWTQSSPAFVNSGPAGFDGLWIDPSAHGANIVSSSAGYAYAAVEQARRSQWFVAGLRPLVDAGSAAPGDGSVDTSKARFKLDRVTLDQIGCKALFVQPPDGAQWTDSETRWLDWLHASDVERNSISVNFASTKPEVVFYPTNVSLPGASIETLGDSIWWLPSFQPGTLLDLGDNLEGYSMNNQGDSPTFVVYATGSAPVSLSFRFPPTVNVVARSPGGLPALLTYKKGLTTLTFSQTPVVVSGITAFPLPQGAADAAMQEAVRLVADCALVNIPTELYEQRLEYIKSNLMIDQNKGEQVAYDNISLMIQQLRSVISPYVWIEGEDAISNNFEGVVSADSASRHAFLWVDSSREPPNGSDGIYKATYDFAVNAPDSYTVWAAFAPGAPGTTGVSPIVMATDQSPSVDIDRPETGGDAYGTLPVPTPAGARGGFTWCNLGVARLESGQHTLTLSLGGRAPGTNRYTLGIDAICIARAPFSPDGARQPEFEAPSSALQTTPSHGAGKHDHPQAIATPDDTPPGS